MRQRDLALCDRSVWLRGLSRFSRNKTMWPSPSLSIAWDFGSWLHRRAARHCPGFLMGIGR